MSFLPQGKSGSQTKRSAVGEKEDREVGSGVWRWLTAGDLPADTLRKSSEEDLWTPTRGLH